MTSESLKHIVFVGGANWSHVRHGIKFSTRLVEKFPNAFISIFLFAGLAPQASKYLSIQSPSARARTRIALSTLPDQMTSPLDLLSSVKSSFPPWMDEQLRSGGFEVEGIAVAPPSLIIEDHIMGGISLVWKEGNKEQGIPIVSFWVAPAASFIAHIGNAEHGQGGRLINAIQAALEKQEPGNEKSIEEILRQELNNRVVYVPGLPPHYEHEQVPGIFAPILSIVSILQTGWDKAGKQMHTLILGSTYEMEPIAAEACKIAFTNPVTPFCVGPSFDLPSSSPPSRDPSDPVFAFLNSAEPHSVIYIGFGTLFFPLPESQPHLEIINEEILQQGFKLILTLSSEQAQLREEFLESIEKRWKGMAMFSKWVDQLAVLEHPAIHYFLSHGGWNSTTEAIVRGVPMIFWPFAGDQPTNVLQIAHQHGCGFELLQVRSGVARSTAYPNIPIVGTNEAVRDEIKGVLEMSKGGRGAHQRANVRALGKIMVESVGKGGSGDMAMSKFGESFGL